MKSLKRVLCFATLAVLGFGSLPVSAQDATTRKELRRTDLSGAPGMEVILSISEFKPGDEIVAHFTTGWKWDTSWRAGWWKHPGNLHSRW